MSMPLTIQISDDEAIRIVINEAARRGIKYGGGRQIATAIIKEWAASRSQSSFQIHTKEVFSDGTNNNRSVDSTQTSTRVD